MSMPAFSFSVPMTVLLPQEPKAPAPGPTGPGTTGAGPAGPGTGTGTTEPDAPAGTGTAQTPCGTDMFLMMGLFVALMWLMVLRPESKRRKETQAMLTALKQGDTVVTLGGMHGKVATISDKTIVLRIDTQMVTFDRSAIARVVRDDAPPAKS